MSPPSSPKAEIHPSLSQAVQPPESSAPEPGTQSMPAKPESEATKDTTTSQEPDRTAEQEIADIKDWLRDQQNNPPHHGSHIYPLLTPQHITPSPNPQTPHQKTLTFTLPITASLTNTLGILHGGAVALILDLCTSLALNLVSRPGFWDAGHVSRNLNVTYLKGVPAGETVVVEAEVLGLGRRMASTRGLIRGKDGGVRYVCLHDKVALGGRL